MHYKSMQNYREFPVESRSIKDDLDIGRGLSVKAGLIQSPLDEDDKRHKVILDEFGNSISPTNLKYEPRCVNSSPQSELKGDLETKGVTFSQSGKSIPHVPEITELHEKLWNALESNEEVAEAVQDRPDHKCSSSHLETMIINVGRSSSETKTVCLPFPNMRVNSKPLNQLCLCRKDEFNVEVSGTTLIVTRTDSFGIGWGYKMKLIAEYSPSDAPEHLYNETYYYRGTRMVLVDLEDNPVAPFQFNCKFIGEDGQQSNITEIEIRPGQVLRAEKESLLYLQHGDEGEISFNVPPPTIEMDRKKGSKQVLVPKRDIIRSCFYSYSGSNSTSGLIGLAGTLPHSSILLFPLEELGNKLFCRRGSFLASSSDVIVKESDLVPTFYSCTGSGDLFIQAGPTVIKKGLKAGEHLTIRADCIVAFTQYVDFHTDDLEGGTNYQIRVATKQFVNLDESESTNRRRTRRFAKDAALAHLTGPGTAWFSTGLVRGAT